MHALILALLAAILPPCATEDATNCYWDASTQGNSLGSSFIDIGGTAYFLDGDLSA